VLKASFDVGRTTFQEAVVVQRLLSKVDALNLGTPNCLIPEVVTERGAAGGSAIALARSANSAALCGLGASTFGFDAAMLFHILHFFYKFVVATGRLFCQISAKKMSAMPSSVGRGVIESGTASILRASPSVGKTNVL